MFHAIQMDLCFSLSDSVHHYFALVQADFHPICTLTDAKSVRACNSLLLLPVRLMLAK